MDTVESRTRAKVILPFPPRTIMTKRTSTRRAAAASGSKKQATAPAASPPVTLPSPVPAPRDPPPPVTEAETERMNAVYAFPLRVVAGRDARAPVQALELDLGPLCREPLDMAISFYVQRLVKRGWHPAAGDFSHENVNKSFDFAFNIEDGWRLVCAPGAIDEDTKLLLTVTSSGEAAAADDAGRQKHPLPVPIDEAASLPDGRVLLVLPATAAAAAAVKEPDYAKMRKEAETHAQKDFREGSHNMWFADLIDRRVPGGFAEAYAGAAKAKRRIDELEAEVAELKKARVSEQAKRVWHGMTRGVSTATDTAIEWTKRTAWPTIMEAIRARGILK